MKTTWYKVPLTLLLAVCLTLGGLPMVAMADNPAPVSLGYSIVAVEDGREYIIDPNDGIEYVDLPLTFENTIPTLNQLQNDLVPEIVVSDVMSREPNNIAVSFVESSSGLAVRIELNYAFVTTVKYELEFCINILRKDTKEVILTSDTNLLTVHPEYIDITREDANPSRDVNNAIYTGNGEVLFWEDTVKVPIVASLADPDSIAGYKVYTSITMGEEEYDDEFGENLTRYSARGIAYCYDVQYLVEDDFLDDDELVEVTDKILRPSFRWKPST